MSLLNQIYIPENGDVCSILQRSFSTDGEKIFCKIYKTHEWNDKKRNFEVGDIVILKEQTVNITSGC